MSYTPIRIIQFLSNAIFEIWYFTRYCSDICKVWWDSLFKVDFIANFLMSLTVKELQKSISIWRNTDKSEGIRFLDHHVCYIIKLITIDQIIINQWTVTLAWLLQSNFVPLTVRWEYVKDWRNFCKCSGTIQKEWWISDTPFPQFCKKMTDPWNNASSKTYVDLIKVSQGANQNCIPLVYVKSSNRKFLLNVLE